MIPFHYIFGPLDSWRLGQSLGIDPIFHKDKICNYDCVYCQLGPTHNFVNDRRVFVQTRDILDEVKQISSFENIDFLTISGRGEPTLALNLGELIQELRKLHGPPIAVITNSSLIKREDVQEDLLNCDLVIAKLDAVQAQGLNRVDRPGFDVDLVDNFKSLKSFRHRFKGCLRLEVMCVKENCDEIPRLALLAKVLAPDIVDLNTPLRACASAPLTKKELEDFKKHFLPLPIQSVYEVKPHHVDAFDLTATKKRHGIVLKNKN